MAPRMSEGPSWAMIEPSRKPTIEWTTDCGCISTSIRSGATSKSSRASITSSALLNIVALSMEMRSPMSQFGMRPRLGRRGRGHPLAASSRGTARRRRSG